MYVCDIRVWAMQISSFLEMYTMWHAHAKTRTRVYVKNDGMLMDYSSVNREKKLNLKKINYKT